MRWLLMVVMLLSEYSRWRRTEECGNIYGKFYCNDNYIYFYGLSHDVRKISHESIVLFTLVQHLLLPIECLLPCISGTKDFVFLPKSTNNLHANWQL